jgi:predicted TIM-barrel fold metal-dependent hydrolase
MFDINTAIGHWPFRQAPNQSAAALRAHLSRYGITHAAVAHTHGLFYKNCHDANLELSAEIASHRDFFVGVATLNPGYAACERDLAACVDNLGFRGLRLVPQYHDYSLTDACAVDIVKAAAFCNIPVFIPHRVVDVRQSHWMDTRTATDPADVLTLARSVPEAHIIFTEFPVKPDMVTDESGWSTCANVYVETSRFVSAYGQELSKVMRSLGTQRVLFGTGSPFKEVRPAVLKIESADFTDTERKMVIQDNALALLGGTVNKKNEPPQSLL